jgi:hypothetical protein
MIIAFETEPSKELNEYLDETENPKRMVNSIIKNMAFIEFKILRFDNLIIILRKSYADVFAQFGTLLAIGGLLTGVLMKSNIIMLYSFILIMVGLMILSPYVAFYSQYWIKLKLIKHKPKIEWKSKTYVINKLINEIENGTIRNL